MLNPVKRDNKKPYSTPRYNCVWYRAGINPTRWLARTSGLTLSPPPKDSHLTTQKSGPVPGVFLRISLRNLLLRRIWLRLIRNAE